MARSEQRLNMSNDTYTIQEMMDQLEQLLAWFESDDVTVEMAVEKYEAATQLSVALEDRLKNAQNQIEVIKKKYSKD
jgi:exodeoxyribonuclease VII small subunit